jgi:uncharacterized protein (TIGR03790 family)
MKKLLGTILMTVLLTTIGYAQTRTYSDVLVLSNSNSSISRQVASYFKAQRAVPDINMCEFAMPTTDEIDSLQFVNIAATIKNYMVSNGLTTTIQYIVTTQGVPLKVRRSSSVFSLISNAASFDSELTLLQSNYEGRIGLNGTHMNPYYQKTTTFSRAANTGISALSPVLRL